ncbi:hypothetical protein RsTz2092_04420 [Deferribacterales bacterium RsTz2092]
MKQLFFLGAGFSKAIADDYPSLGELSRSIDEDMTISMKSSTFEHYRQEIHISFLHHT